MALTSPPAGPAGRTLALGVLQAPRKVPRLPMPTETPMRTGRGIHPLRAGFSGVPWLPGAITTPRTVTPRLPVPEARSAAPGPVLTAVPCRSAPSAKRGSKGERRTSRLTSPRFSPAHCSLRTPPPDLTPPTLWCGPTHRPNPTLGSDSTYALIGPCFLPRPRPILLTLPPT